MSALLVDLRNAIHTHDLDALAACFADDFRNETPVHPTRDFVGRDQVRANWAQIFGGVPDIQATLVRSTVDADIAWAEWEFAGTRRDGAPHMLRGVTVFRGRDGRVAWVRFYMEPVDSDDCSSVEEHITATMTDVRH